MVLSQDVTWSAFVKPLGRSVATSFGSYSAVPAIEAPLNPILPHFTAYRFDRIQLSIDVKRNGFAIKFTWEIGVYVY